MRRSSTMFENDLPEIPRPVLEFSPVEQGAESGPMTDTSQDRKRPESQTKRAIESVIHENYGDTCREIARAVERLSDLYRHKAELEAVAAVSSITLLAFGE